MMQNRQPRNAKNVGIVDGRPIGARPAIDVHMHDVTAGGVEALGNDRVVVEIRGIVVEGNAVPLTVVEVELGFELRAVLICAQFKTQLFAGFGFDGEIIGIFHGIDRAENLDWNGCDRLCLDYRVVRFGVAHGGKLADVE